MAIPRVKSTKSVTYLGAALTLLYLSAVMFMILRGNVAIMELPPNEIGDFLAGASAPLAFLWLVLGFVQQGHELRNSAEALRLQSEELRNSVAQQRDLVEVTREQLTLEREYRIAVEEKNRRDAEPILSIAGGGYSKSGDDFTFRFNLFNAGATCVNVKINCPVPINSPVRLPALQRHEDAKITLKMKRRQIKDVPVNVRYTNARGERAGQEFLIKAKRSGGDLVLVAPEISADGVDDAFDGSLKAQHS